MTLFDLKRSRAFRTSNFLEIKIISNVHHFGIIWNHLESGTVQIERWRLVSKRVVVLKDSYGGTKISCRNLPKFLKNYQKFSKNFPGVVFAIKYPLPSSMKNSLKFYCSAILVSSAILKNRNHKLLTKTIVYILK